MNKSKQNGSSLIEVMIALFVLAIGMLGVLAMQTSSIKLSRTSTSYSQASILATDIIEAMRSTPNNLNAYAITFNATAPNLPNCTNKGTICDSAQIAQWNLASWRRNVVELLPSGDSQIEVDGDKATVSVRFRSGFDEVNQQPIDETVVMTAVFR